MVSEKQKTIVVKPSRLTRVRLCVDTKQVNIAINL